MACQTSKHSGLCEATMPKQLHESDNSSTTMQKNIPIASYEIDLPYIPTTRDIATDLIPKLDAHLVLWEIKRHHGNTSYTSSLNFNRSTQRILHE